MSSSATTAAVTASSMKLAPENEFAMSAPNAGPPVTCACRSPGSPSVAAVAEFFDLVGERKSGQVRRQRHRRDSRLAVFGDLGGGAAGTFPVGSLPVPGGEHAPASAVDGPEVGGAQPGTVGTGHDEDGGYEVPAGEFGARGIGAGGLRSRRHRHGRLFTGFAAGEQAHQGAGDDDDQEGDHPGEATGHIAPTFQKLNN